MGKVSVNRVHYHNYYYCYYFFYVEGGGGAEPCHAMDNSWISCVLEEKRQQRNQKGVIINQNCKYIHDANIIIFGEGCSEGGSEGAGGSRTVTMQSQEKAARQETKLSNQNAMIQLSPFVKIWISGIPVIDAYKLYIFFLLFFLQIGLPLWF